MKVIRSENQLVLQDEYFTFFSNWVGGGSFLIISLLVLTDVIFDLTIAKVAFSQKIFFKLLFGFGASVSSIFYLFRHPFSKVVFDGLSKRISLYRNWIIWKSSPVISFGEVAGVHISSRRSRRNTSDTWFLPHLKLVNNSMLPLTTIATRIVEPVRKDLDVVKSFLSKNGGPNFAGS